MQHNTCKTKTKQQKTLFLTKLWKPHVMFYQFFLLSGVIVSRSNVIVSRSNVIVSRSNVQKTFERDTPEMTPEIVCQMFLAISQPSGVRFEFCKMLFDSGQREIKEYLITFYLPLINRPLKTLQTIRNFRHKFWIRKLCALSWL